MYPKEWNRFRWTLEAHWCISSAVHSFIHHRIELARLRSQSSLSGFMTFAGPWRTSGCWSHNNVLEQSVYSYDFLPQLPVCHVKHEAHLIPRDCCTKFPSRLQSFVFKKFRVFSPVKRAKIGLRGCEVSSPTLPKSALTRNAWKYVFAHLKMFL